MIGTRDGTAPVVPRPGRFVVTKAKELPEHAVEFVDMAKEYVRERTVEPAKALGRLAGIGFAAASVFVLAAVFLGIAAMRLIVDVLPDGRIWSGLGLILAAIGLFLATGLVMWRASK